MINLLVRRRQWGLASLFLPPLSRNARSRLNSGQNYQWQTCIKRFASWNPHWITDSVAIVLMPNKKKIWGNFEGVTRCDTLKVFQVKLGSLAWASIKVAGSLADATDMLVSLFVIISRPSQGRNHIALMMLLTTKIVVMKRWMRMTREI